MARPLRTDSNGDGQWFPRWFWWPFYAIGFPILIAKRVWAKLAGGPS